MGEVLFPVHGPHQRHAWHRLSGIPQTGKGSAGGVYPIDRPFQLRLYGLPRHHRRAGRGSADLRRAVRFRLQRGVLDGMRLLLRRQTGDAAEEAVEAAEEKIEEDSISEIPIEEEIVEESVEDEIVEEEIVEEQIVEEQIVEESVENEVVEDEIIENTDGSLQERLALEDVIFEETFEDVILVFSSSELLFGINFKAESKDIKPEISKLSSNLISPKYKS